MKVDRFISHRGANTDAVENTIESFQIARNYGIKWFETDLQMSSDKEVFLFHDQTPRRLAPCDKNVTEMTISELKELELTHPILQVKGKIPTLREYLEWASENDAFSNFEFKITNKSEEYQEELVEKALMLLKEFPNLKNKVFLSSFSKVVMKELKKYKKYPKGKLFYTTNWPKDFGYIDKKVYKYFKECDYIAIIINYGCLTKKRVEYLKSKFKRVYVYSVYTDYEVQQLISWGIDAMFIDKKEQIALS
ncbi:glycerophosphodiester phosphodiesterase [Candidatus Francisella endociliophora]|uniref:Glycerophosphodiester phosphodiesterase n=1 Tax=Candidatus Francisella endociliophora TaxID=653937 RepID=A0A097ERH9_9GAMM|nr:glycerophosphodiester phosphodiesterase family protein [Francisella sp. FSC1006]AIT10164.1 glycerophosphodiester phosphodiesterase [Francisella sp. FSC1006]